jgi:hypothetical protein
MNRNDMDAGMARAPGAGLNKLVIAANAGNAPQQRSWSSTFDLPSIKPRARRTLAFAGVTAKGIVQRFPGASPSRAIGVALAVLAASSSLSATANTFTITPMSTSAWNISVDASAARSNPTLTLLTGQTYTFDVAASTFHPFWIKTVRSTGTGNAYAGSGLSDNGVTSSTTITFDVPADAPATLFYDCGNHPAMTGTITIIADLIFKEGFE